MKTSSSPSRPTDMARLRRFAFCDVTSPRRQIGGVLDGGQRIRDCNREFAGRKKGVIVFRITDSDYVVHGKAQTVQGRLQSRSLVHAGGKNHYGAFIEDDL